MFWQKEYDTLRLYRNVDSEFLIAEFGNQVENITESDIEKYGALWSKNNYYNPRFSMRQIESSMLNSSRIEIHKIDDSIPRCVHEMFSGFSEE